MDPVDPVTVTPDAPAPTPLRRDISAYCVGIHRGSVGILTIIVSEGEYRSL